MSLFEWLKTGFYKLRYKLIFKDKLPIAFDVFCIGDLSFEHSNEKIPGTLYVGGSLDASDLTICENLIVNGNIDTNNLTVYGNCIGSNSIKASDITIINGSIICIGSSVDAYSINVKNGDCIVHHIIDSYEINVDGTIDCYNVVYYGHKPHCADYVCRYYEGE